MVEIFCDMFTFIDKYIAPSVISCACNVTEATYIIASHATNKHREGATMHHILLINCLIFCNYFYDNDDNEDDDEINDREMTNLLTHAFKHAQTAAHTFLARG